MIDRPLNTIGGFKIVAFFFILEAKHIPVGLFLILVRKTELTRIGALIYLKNNVLLMLNQKLRIRDINGIGALKFLCYVLFVKYWQ